MTTFTVKKENEHITLDHSDEYRIEIVAEGVQVKIVGAFATHEKEQIDIHLTIVHKAAHTRANTILKGAAFDNSSIRFFGRIIIEPNCPDTQSFLEERVLVLSDKAKAETVPELEIKTDDVKCSHAASISRIPQEHLFYLQSRGIPKAKAEEMIVEGFLKLE
ncbi:hypothetical protein C5B42_02890 [Candidatus Cerribacteria bacterium 'Amazon FNV 2010 28 9']|uniref:SUF system FeS cluster assembly SufBD core domain-containing protein n=1 Tax=Candidatus Cerribacteria bacterium 'Amazon FNV 2010 28 9' TaxID=2081795 RepID=A0A317JSX0_9BACT|nr:MAG: hypothetical protein C5B42_02890 [Candidatus Cerribacteria bacterium 'Amazon FNV 2010 28 9']